ncbi:hemolysin [Pseudoalteromonas sp. MMG010]|uniref:hemolysin n=1 Tax=Pseudoalteromonas sp. MMG010 TaxID=2822685 RepID=UPI001B39D5D1|nr:hemolysin [Pseudoalteromonas sp. MMG010]MBQ4832404.1 hemolysin [Pseudoalteromonas sp. MMG010]
MLKSAFKLAITATAVLTSLNIQTAYANECTGQIYGINSGRGETGIVFQLNEGEAQTLAHSKAEFSSAAMAFDSHNNRLYYIAAPRPYEYQVDTSHLDLNSTEKESLPISGSKFKYTRLAYVDLATNEHTIVGYTKSVYRLVYDSENKRLLGSYTDKVYAIDPETAEYDLLGELSGVSSDGIWRGDMVYKDGQLILVTSSDIYSVNLDTLQATKLSEHNLTTVTGASLNQSGDIILSRTLITDFGYSNKSQLYKVNETTGKTCHVADVPVRIDDLATDTNAGVSCYATPICDVIDEPTISLNAQVDNVVEGETLSYTLTLSHAYDADSEILVSTISGTADSSDYDYEEQTVTILAGETSVEIAIPTYNNEEYSDSKTFTVTASGKLNATGDATAPATIENDDAQCTDTKFYKFDYSFIRENSNFNNDWGLSINGTFVKLLDEYGASGSYETEVSNSIRYALAVNGDTNNLKTNYKVSGSTQYWEDQNDTDFNDFVVNVSLSQFTECK